jgi:ribonucleotide reductase beta subunit family protein with ferritin-like domain
MQTIDSESTNSTIEPLLDERNNRLTIYPIKFPQVWKEYKKQQSCMWVVEEVDLSKDIDDWNKLNDNEQFFLKNVLAFFAASDGIVNMNLLERFMNEVQPPEVRCAYGFQFAMENIHSEGYSLQIDTYVKDPVEKEHLLNAMETIPCVKEKADWAMKWINGTEPFGQRLIAFAIVEGIYFSGSFAAIFWLQDRNLMPGLCKFNKFIARDEGMHTDFACLLYSMVIEKMDQQTIEQMVREAVTIEKNFITESLPCNLIGINAELMKEYIEFVADRLVVQLGYERIYNVTKCPLEFMEKISMQAKENMFEGRVDEYQNAHIFKSKEESQFIIDDDF